MSSSLKALPWSPEMEVGIEAIDLDHHTLVMLYNDLIRAVQKQTSAMTIVSFLSTLQNNLFRHFSEEEKILNAWNRRLGEEHAKQHRLAEQAFFSMTFNTDDHAHLEAVAHFMHDWIIHHIQVEDREIFAELMAQGAPTPPG
jgi:hemerythrin-like metal-binding protein